MSQEKEFASDAQRRAFFGIFGDTEDSVSWQGGETRDGGLQGSYYDYGHMTDNPSRTRSTMLATAHAKKMATGEKQAVSRYTNDEQYKEINGYFRGKQGDISPENQRAVQELDSALGKSTLAENTVVYRGMTMTPDLRKKFKPGTTFVDSAYISTSLSQAKAESFSGGADTAVIRIKAPKGTNALAVETISEYADEKEIILPRNSRIVVTKVTESDDGRTYIDAKVLRSEKDKAMYDVQSSGDIEGGDKFAWSPDDIVFGTDLFADILAELAEQEYVEKSLQPGITVFKAIDGLRHMLIVSSNAYEDREEEIVREKALQNYVKDFQEGVEYAVNNDLLVWHGGDPVGRIVDAEMVGPFLIEVAEELPDSVVNLAREEEQPFLTTIRDVWDVFESPPDYPGASIGFGYLPGEKADSTYQRIFKFETSILPVIYAANSYTFGQVLEI